MYCIVSWLQMLVRGKKQKKQVALICGSAVVVLLLFGEVQKRPLLVN